MPSRQEMNPLQQAPLTPRYPPHVASPYPASSQSRPVSPQVRPNSLSPFRGKSRRALSLPAAADAVPGRIAHDAQDGDSGPRKHFSSHTSRCEMDCGKCGKKRISGSDRPRLDGASNFPSETFRVTTPDDSGANRTRCGSSNGLSISGRRGPSSHQPSTVRLTPMPQAHTRSISESQVGLGITIRPLNLKPHSSPDSSCAQSCGKCGKLKKPAPEGGIDVHRSLQSGPLNSNPLAQPTSSSATPQLLSRRTSTRQVTRKPLATTSSQSQVCVPTPTQARPFVSSASEPSTSHLIRMVSNAINESTTPPATLPSTAPLKPTEHDRLSVIESLAETVHDLEMQTVPPTATETSIYAPQIIVANSSPISLSPRISYEIPVPDLGDVFTNLLLPQEPTAAAAAEGIEEGEDYSYLTADSYSHDMGLALPIDGMLTRFKSLRTVAGGSLRRNASTISAKGGGLIRFESLRGIGKGYSHIGQGRKESPGLEHGRWYAGQAYGNSKGIF